MASPSVSILSSYNAPGAKGSLVVGPGGFTATDGCTFKISIDLPGRLAWGTHRDRSCRVGHPRAETRSPDRRHDVTSGFSFLETLSARVGRRDIPSGLPHHPAGAILASLIS